MRNTNMKDTEKEDYTGKEKCYVLARSSNLVKDLELQTNSDASFEGQQLSRENPGEKFFILKKKRYDELYKAMIKMLDRG